MISTPDQFCFVKEILKSTSQQSLDEYQVVVYSPNIKQIGLWYTNNPYCDLTHQYESDPYTLSTELVVGQDYNQVERNFLLSDRFIYSYQKQIVINTTRRITELMQRLIQVPNSEYLKDVDSFKNEYLLPHLKDDERKNARVALADALDNWFYEKIPETYNIWFDFLRTTVGFCDWILVAQFLDTGKWLYEPKLDGHMYDHFNALTFTVVNFMESKTFPQIDKLVERSNDIERLADRLQNWFVQILPYSVTERDIFSQLVLTGIHCVDWIDVAKSISLPQ